MGSKREIFSLCSVQAASTPGEAICSLQAWHGVEDPTAVDAFGLEGKKRPNISRIQPNGGLWNKRFLAQQRTC